MPIETTFESLLRWSEQLDFHLECRIADDGRESAVPEANLDWVEAVCRFHLRTDAEVRNQVRTLFNTDDKLWHLFKFIDNRCNEVKTRSDQEPLKLAFVALAIEGGRFDFRDTSLMFNKLVRTARNAGIDSRPIREEIASISEERIRSSLLGCDSR